MENRYTMYPPSSPMRRQAADPAFQKAAAAVLLAQQTTQVPRPCKTMQKCAPPPDYQQEFFRRNPCVLYLSLERSLKEFVKKQENRTYDINAPPRDSNEARSPTKKAQPRKTASPVRRLPNRLEQQIQEIQELIAASEKPQRPQEKPAVLRAKTPERHGGKQPAVSPFVQRVSFQPEISIAFSPVQVVNRAGQDVIFFDEKQAEADKLRRAKHFVDPDSPTVSTLAAELAKKYEAQTPVYEPRPADVKPESPAKLAIDASSSREDAIDMREVKLADGSVISVNANQFKPNNWLDDHGILYGLDVLLGEQDCFVLDPLAFSSVQIMERCVQVARSRNAAHFVAQICQDEHWIGMLYSVPRYTLFMFDGLNLGAADNKKLAFVHFLGSVLGREMVEAGANLSKGNYRFERLRMSYQNNSYDCGVYSMLGAQRVISGASLQVQQREVDELRRRLLRRLVQ